MNLVGSVYIIGGIDSNNVPLNIVRSYWIPFTLNDELTEDDLEEDQVASMTHARKCPGVTTMYNGIFVCGGSNDAALRSCELYNEQDDR